MTKNKNYQFSILKLQQKTQIMNLVHLNYQKRQKLSTLYAWTMTKDTNHQLCTLEPWQKTQIINFVPLNYDKRHKLSTLYTQTMTKDPKGGCPSQTENVSLSEMNVTLSAKAQTSLKCNCEHMRKGISRKKCLCHFFFFKKHFSTTIWNARLIVNCLFKRQTSQRTKHKRRMT